MAVQGSGVRAQQSLCFRSRAACDQERRLTRSLGRVLILVGILLFLQGFGLGGVIATFGLARDLIGFVLLLVVVLVSSVTLLTRKNAIPNTAVRIKSTTSLASEADPADPP